MKFIIISIIILIIFYLIIIKENFISCIDVPSGPYKTKCTNIEFNDNILYALCPKQEPANTFQITNLNLTNCVKNSNDCNSINVNSQGKLVCE